MHRFPLLVLLCCAFTQVLAQTDSSATDLTSMDLEDLVKVKVTTASKISQEAKKAPATVIVITEEQIRTRGYRSLLDVLHDLPDYKVDDMVSSSYRNYITVRGVQGQEKFMILLDGVRITSSTNELMPVMENYPVHLAKQIEVVYGPSSALYGADAVTGIINIITKKAEVNDQRAEASYAMGDNGLYNGTMFLSRKLGNETVLTLSGQYFYDQGVNKSKLYSSNPLWDMTSHTTGQFNSIFGPVTPAAPVSPGYAAPLLAYNAYASLSTGDFTLSLFKNYAQNSTAIDNNPNNTVYNKNVLYGRGITVLNALYTKSLHRITLTSTLTGSQSALNPRSNYRNLYTGMEPAYKYSSSSMLKAEQQVEWNINTKFDLVGGVTYENFFAVPNSPDLQDPVTDSRTIEGTLLGTAAYYNPNGIAAKFYTLRYNNLGSFVQLQYEPSERIALTLGTRYDYNSRYKATINPRFGMVWNASHTTTLKALAGSAYLAPSPDLSYGYYGSFYTLDSGQTYHSNFFHLPNPGLEPVHVLNGEVSVQQKIGKQLHATLTGYCTSLTNLVEYEADEQHTDLYNGQFLGWDVDYIEVFVNEGRQDNIGGTLMLEHTLLLKKGKINFYASLSYVDGTTEIDHTTGSDKSHKYAQIDFMTPLLIKAGTDITSGNFSLSPRCIVVGKQRLSAFKAGTQERQTLDGYTLLNVSAAYRIKKVSVFANVTNVLNIHYKNLGPNLDLEKENSDTFYGYDQDPLRVNAGLRVTL